MKKSTRKKTTKRTTRKVTRRNPTITLDDINRIGGNVARDIRQEGVFLRRGSSEFEYLTFNRGRQKITFKVSRGDNGILFTVKINSSAPRYWEINENGDEIYWFLTDLFLGELT